MNNIKAAVAVYSHDNEFIDSLGTHGYTGSKSEDEQFSYYLLRSSSEIAALLVSDVVVYDLDMVGNEFPRVTEDILHIKLNSRTKPLIVVGSRAAIEQVLASPKLRTVITKTIVKPVLRAPLHLTLDSVLGNISPAWGGRNTSGRKFGWSAVALLFVVCALAVAVTGAIFFERGDSSNSISVLDNAQAVALNRQAVDASNDQEAGIEKEEIAELEKLAENALARGDLAFPKNDNALAYYDQILEIDTYHSRAYSDRARLLATLRNSFSALLQYGELKQADQVLQVLRVAEPYSDGNRTMSLALRNAKRENTRRSQVISVAKSTAPVPVDRHIDSSVNVAAISNDTHMAIERPAVIETPIVVQTSAANTRVSAGINQESHRLESALNKDAALPALGKAKLHVGKPEIRAITHEKKSSVSDVVVLKRAAPRYPSKALSQGLEGWVEVAYQVNERGRAVNAKVIKAEPQKVFDKSSIRAIEKWKFVPAKDSQTGKTILSAVNKTIFRFNAS